MLIGSVLGLVIGVPLSSARGQLAVLGTYLPLGTFLALGAAVAHAWGGPLFAWYINLLT
jgi:prepilin signal peptidase PulO-like enzyme (type II secretory pathway)